MNETNARARAAIHEIADGSPRPPSVAQLDGHTPLPHRPPPWVGRAVTAVVAVALLGLVVRWTAQMGDHADINYGGPETTATATTTEATTSTTTGIYLDPAIAEWSSRIAGKTITYTADFSCFCANSGRWQITERDGALLSATFLSTDGPTPEGDPFLFSNALRLAARADGSVFVKESSPTSLSMEVDVEKNAIDDEFSYAVTNIIIGDDATSVTSTTSSTPATSTALASAPLTLDRGTFLGLGLNPTLNDAARALGVEPDPSEVIPSPPGSTWTPCVSGTLPHWTLTSGGLVMVFEGDTTDTAILTNWAYFGGPVALYPGLLTSEGIGVGGTRADLEAAYSSLQNFGSTIDVNEPASLRFGLQGDTIVWLGRVDCATEGE